MEKLKISRSGNIKRLLERDKQEGKLWGIYHEDHPIGKQPKGYPKRFKTKGEAEKQLANMQIFKQLK